MSTLQLALVQKTSAVDPAANRDRLRAAFDELASTGPAPDLVVFPEAFQCDFGTPGTDVSPYAEDLDGPFVEEVTALAKEHGTAVVAGMFQRSGTPDRPFNTLVVVDGDGLRASYRKIHLYDSFGYKESERLTAGPVEPVVVDVAGVAVGLMTCYDLRFPELARRLTAEGAELLLVPAAWVAGPRKVQHWRTLATARAIENTVFVAAAGQPGPRYTGHSLVVDPRGEEVSAPVGDEETLVRVRLDPALLREARAENPSLANRRF